MATTRNNGLHLQEFRNVYNAQQAINANGIINSDISLPVAHVKHGVYV